MATDSNGCLSNNLPWLAVSQVPLRKDNTFLATGKRMIGKANSTIVFFAVDTIQAKGTKGKLAKTILEKFILPNS